MNYPTLGGNQGWNIEQVWRDRDKDSRDWNATWKEKEVEKDRYV